MKSFEGEKLEKLNISHNLLKTVRLIGEYRGKEELFQNQSPQVLNTLRQSAIIQSTESSNRIEGVQISNSTRLKELIEKNSNPINRSEQEIAGYRDVLNTIHGSYEHIPFTSNLVLQFHRDLFKYTSDQGGIWKQVDNDITEISPSGTKVSRFKPIPAWQTKKAMEVLHKEYNEVSVDPLIAIPAYILDFLCIHPFKDGNGRIARLLSLLVLYKAGYHVGRFISLERIVEETKESYYDSLFKSSQGWHEGKHNLNPWLEYFLGVLLHGSYEEFENRVGLVETAKGVKAAMIVGAIKKLPIEFTIADVVARCPTVGIDHIRKTLRTERDSGNIRSEGRGPRAKWVKILKI